MSENQDTCFTVDEMYRLIREDILTLKLVPGTLVSESQLCNRFKISRTPVRSVIAQLCKDNLLEVHPKRGTFVSKIDLNRATQSLYLRIQVETAVMSELVLHPDGMLFKQLEENLKQQEEAIKQGIYPEEWFRIDSRFHELCVFARNRSALWINLQYMNIDYARYRRLDYLTGQGVKSRTFDNLYEEHKALYQGLINHNLSAIRYLVTNHLYSGLLQRGDAFEHEYANYITSGGVDFKNTILDIKVQLLDAKSF